MRQSLIIWLMFAILILTGIVLPAVISTNSMPVWMILAVLGAIASLMCLVAELIRKKL